MGKKNHIGYFLLHLNYLLRDAAREVDLVDLQWNVDILYVERYVFIYLFYLILINVFAACLTGSMKFFSCSKILCPLILSFDYCLCIIPHTFLCLMLLNVVLATYWLLLLCVIYLFSYLYVSQCHSFYLLTIFFVVFYLETYCFKHPMLHYPDFVEAYLNHLLMTWIHLHVWHEGNGIWHSRFVKINPKWFALT